jgi:hypothetical protein
VVLYGSFSIFSFFGNVLQIFSLIICDLGNTMRNLRNTNDEAVKSNLNLSAILSHSMKGGLSNSSDNVITRVNSKETGTLFRKLAFNQETFRIISVIEIIDLV